MIVYTTYRLPQMPRKKSKKKKKTLKRDLLQKNCVVCQRPFAWRKKWEHCWEEVKYCSKRCSGN